MKKKFLAILLTTISNFGFSQIPSYVPVNGLVAWYPFTGNAVDNSGNVGNDGTVHGATLTADRFGNLNNAYHFDATNYIEGSCSNFPSVARTVSLWYIGANIGRGFPTAKGVFGYGGLGCGESWLQVFDSILFQVAMHCNNNQSTYLTGSLINNAWHHWLITNDGTSETKFYIDGQLALDTAVFYNNTYVSGRDFIIGGIPSPTGFGYYTDANVSAFEGDVDDVGIWDRALTPCEVTQLFTGEILSVTQYPVNYTAGIGDTALFSVVSPNANANFQWQTDSAGSGFHNIHEGTLYTGTTNDTLSVNNVTLDNNQLFRCTVSLPFYCHDTSAAASLIVTGVTPVTLLSFNAVLHAKKVSLKWVTENESDLLSYIIERSSDGFIFSPIGIVSAINTNVRHNYDFTDEAPFAGFNYYRIKSLDVDGKYAYSDTKKVVAQKNILNIYHNPTSGIIQIMTEELGEFEVGILNIQGSQMLPRQRFIRSMHLDLGSLPNGMYFVEIYYINSSRRVTKKVAKMN